MTEIANQSGRDSQPNMDGVSISSNLPPKTDPKSSRDVITQPKVDMVVIYAKCESKTIKFKLCHTARMEKLVSEVAMRLKLEVGSFEMEYLDEIDEKILLTCDADLELCLESITAEGKCYIQDILKYFEVEEDDRGKKKSHLGRFNFQGPKELKRKEEEEERKPNFEVKKEMGLAQKGLQIQLFMDQP